MSLIFVLFVTVKAIEDLQKSRSSILVELKQERHQAKEMRALLTKKNSYIDALLNLLAESASAGHILKLVEEHERVSKEQENVVQELREELSQRDKSVGELDGLVNNLNAQICELISFKARRDAGEYERPHCVILFITMLVPFWLVSLKGGATGKT
jgi:hypothetical protein